MVRMKRFILLNLVLLSGILLCYFPNRSFVKLEKKSQELSSTSTERISHSPRAKIPCNDITQRTYYELRGDFWVLTNYFVGEKTFHCDESITYTTHAEYSYLDNLGPLLERWQGPLSIAVYTPGTDFNETLQRIKYLRECSIESEIIKMYVTFHIFFDTVHIPEEIPRNPDKDKINCQIANPLLVVNNTSYRKSNNLTYPINLGRMIARDMATTFYVLPSDIELYPNPDLIDPFLEMIRRNDSVLQSPNPKVFVLSIFEADSSVTDLPYNKSELIDLMKMRKIVPFHKFVCSNCHRVPKGTEWAHSPVTEGMHVFHVAKRKGHFAFWEPIYIGTKFDPGYDTRLNWEGQRDKMTQGSILRTLNYEFHILDNAFLIHKPGIKRWPTKRDSYMNKAGYRQNRLIDRKIYPELRILYGTSNSSSNTSAVHISENVKSSTITSI